MPSPSYVPVALGRPAGWIPSDYGFETWTHDPGAPASSVAPVSGTVYAIRVPVRRSYTAAAVWWGSVASAVTPVASQNWTGIYDSTGTRLGQVDITAQTTTTGGRRSVVSAAVTGTFVWVAYLFNAATPPTLLRGSSFETTPSMNLATTGLRAAVIASGQTALPASFDPNTLTTNNCLTLFAAIESA